MSSHVYNDKYMQNRGSKNLRNKSHGNQRSYSQHNAHQKRQYGEAMKRLGKYDRVENQRDSYYKNDPKMDSDYANRGYRGGTRGHRTSQQYSPSKKSKHGNEEYDHAFLYDLNLKTEKQMKISNLKHVPIEVNLLNSINSNKQQPSKPVSQQTNVRKNAKQYHQSETDQLLYQPIKPQTGNQTMDAIEQAVKFASGNNPSSINTEALQNQMNIIKQVKSPRTKKQAAEAPSNSIERTVNYKDKQDKDYNQLPDIISDGFKIIHVSGKCSESTLTKMMYRKSCYQKRFRYKQLENQIKNDTQSDNITIRNSKVPMMDDSHSPIRGNDGVNMSEADNLFSLATSSMNSKTFKGQMKPPQAIKQARILASNESLNLSNANRQNVLTQYQDQNQDQTYQQQSIDNSNNTQNIKLNAQQEVQYSKKSTIKRFLTLKDKQNDNSAHHQGPNNKEENNSANVQNNEKISSKQAIKRVMTQKGDGRQRGRGGHGNEQESSDNGITLCKISESGLEELSIVQSDALYESENQHPNDIQEIYNQRILQKMQQPMNHEPTQHQQQREEFRRSNTNKQSQKGRNYKTPQKDKTQFKNNKQFDRSSSPRLFAQNKITRQGEVGRVKSILKNQENIKTKDVQRKYDDPQFSVGNSSEYFMGYSESQFSRHYRRSKQKVQKSLHRNTSNILSSQDGGSSFNISIEKRSNVSNMASQKQYQQKNHQAIKQIKQNIIAQKQQEKSSQHSSSQGKIPDSNLTSVKQDKSSNDSGSPLRIPLFKNQIPKIPGLKRKNRQEKNSKQRGFSKELDQVVEKEELDYSPMKSGSQNEISNFEMGCKMNAEKGNNANKLDQQITSHDKKNIETIKEELITTDSNNIDDSIFDKNSLKNKISHVKIQNEDQKKFSDSNYGNLKNQNMFIPNQQNVSQVKGKSKFYLQDKKNSVSKKEKRNTSPSRNKNVSQVSNKVKNNGGREQNRFSMDSYSKVQQYMNDSNNNSLESRDSHPSIDKNQRTASKNQVKLINQQNMIVSESQASLRLSQDTGGGKEHPIGYVHGQPSKISKNSRYEGSPSKEQQKKFVQGIRKQNTHTDKKSYKDLSSEQNNDGQVIGIETRRSRRSRRSEFERNTKSSQDHSRKLRKSMNQFFNTNESNHNAQDRNNVSPARTSQNTKFDSRKGTAQGTQKYHGYLQSYRINKNQEVLIKDQSAADLQDQSPLLAINKSPCQGVRQKNEVMYQQIKNIYLPTSKLKQQINNLYCINKQTSAPNSNQVTVGQNSSQTAIQQIPVNIVSTNRDLALIQYKQNAKVMQNKMKYLNQGNYRKAQAEHLSKEEVENKHFGMGHGFQGSQDIPSIENLPMMNASINSNQRKLQLSKPGSFKNNPDQYIAYRDNYSRGLSFQDNRKSTKYPEIVMGSRKNNQEKNFSGKKETSSRQGGGWLQKLKQVKPAPIQLQTMPYLKGNTLNNRENMDMQEKQPIDQNVNTNETQDNFIFIQSPRRQTEMEIISNSKNSDQNANYKFSKSAAGKQNTQTCFQQRHGSSIPLSQPNNAPMDTRNLKSQNKARIAGLDTKMESELPHTGSNKMTTLSNKKSKEKTKKDPNQNENSTHLLLEQSNSLLDVKSSNYQQKYAQMENATFYQYNENPNAGGEKKQFFQKRKMENQTCMGGWNKKSQYNSPERSKKMHKSVQKSGQKQNAQVVNNIHFPSPGQGTTINEIYQRKMDSNNMNYKKYMRAHGTEQNFTNFKQNQNLNSIEKKDSYYKQQQYHQ